MFDRFVFYTVQCNMKSEPAASSPSGNCSIQVGKIRSIQVTGYPDHYSDTERCHFSERDNGTINDLMAWLNSVGVDIVVKDTSGINWGTVLINFLPY
jgi:hypothetical protein